MKRKRFIKNCVIVGAVMLLYTEEEYEYLDEKPQEVYEWWAVTNWLGDKLKERGEVVIEGWGHWYWGRGNTGQGIALDLMKTVCPTVLPRMKMVRMYF